MLVDRPHKYYDNQNTTTKIYFILNKLFHLRETITEIVLDINNSIVITANRFTVIYLKKLRDWLW